MGRYKIIYVGGPVNGHQEIVDTLSNYRTVRAMPKSVLYDEINEDEPVKVTDYIYTKTKHLLNDCTVYVCKEDL